MEYKILGKQNLYDKNAFFQIMNEKGDIIKKLPPYFNHDSNIESIKILINAYETIIKSRVQDELMLKYQRQGRILTFAPSVGEEALQVATIKAMNNELDVFCPGYRVNAALLELGIPQELILLYWKGNELGSKIPKNIRSLPLNITIGCQYSHAAGVAYALKQQKIKGVAISFIGNGGTSEGEFYEAMNIASIHNWPVVFCVNNNKWAISTPESKSTNSPTIAIKSVSVGIPGIRVDGNDFFASYIAMKEALHHARNGGPVLVEFLTYRKGPHTTSDDPKIYRTKEMEKEGNLLDPIIRIKEYLLKNKKITNWSEEKDKQLYAKAMRDVKIAYGKIENNFSVKIDEIFDYTYKVLPPELEEQKKTCILENKGEISE